MCSECLVLEALPEYNGLVTIKGDVKCKCTMSKALLKWFAFTLPRVPVTRDSQEHRDQPGKPPNSKETCSLL